MCNNLPNPSSYIMKAQKLQFSSLRSIQTIRKIEDKFLILKTKAGDENAYGKIYDTYVKEIYRFIYLKVASREEAEDLTHEVFIKIWQYVKNNTQAIKNLRAFLYQTARHLTVDYYRKKKSIPLDESQLAQAADRQAVTVIEQQFDKQQKFENLEQALLKIKDQYREVLILKFTQDLSLSEIAKILNKSKGATRVLIHRALKELRNVLES